MIGNHPSAPLVLGASPSEVALSTDAFRELGINLTLSKPYHFH